jgi:hypothetical protein
MPLSLPTDRILERCGLAGTGTSYSSRVSNLAGELGAAISPMIRSEALDDDDLTMLLSSAVMDIVAADFVDILDRTPGAQESITIGDLHIVPALTPGSAALRDRAWGMLRPFLKEEMLPESVTVIAGGERS